MNNLTDHLLYFGKGTYLKRTIEFTNERIHKNSFSECARLMNIEVPEIILPNIKYDWITCCRILESVVEKSQNNLYDFYFEMAKYGVEADLNSVYKMFMSISGPKFVLKLLPSLAKAYNNWMDAGVTQNQPGYCKVDVIYPNNILIENFTIPTSAGGICAAINACKYNADRISVSKSYFINDKLESKKIEIEVWYSKT